MDTFKKLLFGADCCAIKAKYYLKCFLKQQVLKWFSWGKSDAKNRRSNCLRINFSLFLIIILTSGCASKALPVNAFSRIPPGKFVHNISSFESISGFDLDLKNHYDSEWKAKTAGAEVILELQKHEDALNSFGGSLSILYEISQQGKIELVSGLKEIDVSRAELLVAKVKADHWQNFQGKLSFKLKDFWGKSKTVEIKPALLHVDPTHPSDWLNLEVPVRFFKGINFDALQEITIELQAKGVSISGTLGLDEISFFGPENLIFESGRDNLKGFPIDVVRPDSKSIAAISNIDDFFREIAKDSWKYFDQIYDKKTHLILDHIRNGREKSIGAYTSPTNIAFYWLSCVAAFDLGFISKQDAISRIKASIETLRKLALWEDKYYYNFYRTVTLNPSSRFVSSVDNAWLVAALVVVRQAFPGTFDEYAGKTIRDINFAEFYDESNGQIRLGFDEDNATFTSSHYGLIISEARLISYLAIGKGDLPKEHWAKVFRTLPKKWEWQSQVPEGSKREIFGEEVFQGYYRYKERKIVPSWGGSLFEFLAPSLLVNEQNLGSASIGLNNQIATELHMDYALREKKYPVWGIAPAAVPDGKNWRYKEFGVKALGAKGYPDEGVIAPYASSLAIEMKANDVAQNFRKMLYLYPDIYGPYGFYDAVNVHKKRVNHQYLALDQGMKFIALTNYLTNGSIRNRFHADPIGQKAEELLKAERFFV